MHTIDPKALDASQAFSTKPKKEQKYKGSLVFLLVSLVVHLLIGLLIIVKLNFGKINQIAKESSQKPAVVSYLYTAKKKAPPPVKVIEQTIEAETIKDIPKAIVPKTQVSQAPQVTEAIDTVFDTKQVNPSTSLVENTEQKPSSTLRSSIQKFGIKDTVKHQLESYEQAQTQALAEQASKDFQQALVSPQIDAPTYTDEYIKKKQSLAIETDCSNTAKKYFKIATGLVGGRFTCQNYQIQEFIDKRQNKK